jgi:multidrug efflux pump subunit AcrB
MKKGEQINRFGTAVHSRVEDISRALPDDLVIGITSDQQRQVREKLDLFNRSLWEAVVLVVLVSFVGFWEWRSALLMALSIPVTLAMTFGLMQLVGLDIQQMSIASLIIALGLLVDDPVVAGDAIKRELAQGASRATAAWLGPEKLSRAILYATITNIAAYLPFLLLNSDVGRYISSLPMTIACSLVASRVMSMSFLPLLAFYILKPETTSDARRPRDSRFGKIYERAVILAIDNRWRVLATSSVVLAAGAFFVTQLHRQFFRATTSTSRMWTFVCPRTRQSPRQRRSRAKQIRSFVRSQTITIGRRAPMRPWHPLPRSSEPAAPGSGSPSDRSHPPRITRSCCCNSLEAKTPTEWSVRFRRRFHRAWRVRGSTYARSRPGRQRSSLCRCGSWVMTHECFVNREKSYRPF